MSGQRYMGHMLDPKVVRDFANFILAKKENLEASVNRLNQYSQWVDENWQDRQNHIFRERFIPHMHNLKKLYDLLDQYALFCNEAADKIEEYNLD